MKSVFITITFVLLVCNTAISQTFFDLAVDKVWEGKGTLMSSPATFKMKWKKTLNDQFYQLEFQNQMVNNGQTFDFSAKAYYKKLNDSTFVGTWFDSRGITFPVKGKVSKNELFVEWGTPETEMGRTTYTFLKNGQIRVSDYIEQKGNEVKFGEATYSKLE